MQTQLGTQSRHGGISDVQMTVEGTPITATEVPVRVTRVDPSPAVLTSIGLFGSLTGDTVEPIDASPTPSSRLAPSSIELEADRSLAAIRTQQGSVASALADGARSSSMMSWPHRPSIDAEGAIWSVPAAAPTQMRAITAEGVPRDVGNAWPDAAEITAMQISRDGTRIAAVVTVSGVREVWVAGIQRTNGDIDLGPPHVLSFSQPGAFDLAWLDDTTIGVLSSVDGVSTLHELGVGGRGTDSVAPEGTRTLAAGSTSVRVLDDWDACSAAAEAPGRSWPPASVFSRRSRAPLPDAPPQGSGVHRPRVRPTETGPGAEGSPYGPPRPDRVALRDALTFWLPLACAGCDDPDVSLCDGCRGHLAPRPSRKLAPSPI